MKTCRQMVLLIIFLGIFAPLRGAQVSPADRPRPTHADLVYGEAGGQPLKLDLYLPKDVSRPVPLIVHVHGGGWKNGSKDILQSYYFDALGLGFAVASVQYRLTSQAGQWGGAPVTFPAQIHDVKGAVRFLRANAKQYNLDPERFAAWGESAGGHLVALLGVTGDVKELEGEIGGNPGVSSRVQAVVDYYGPTSMMQARDDVTTPPGTIRRHDAPEDNKAILVGWDQPGQGLGDIRAHWDDPAPPYPELRHRMEMVSPVTHVKAGLPPFFIGQGTNDLMVPLKQAVRLADALKAAGNRVKLVIAEGFGHGNLGPATDRAALEFVCEVLAPETRAKAAELLMKARTKARAGKAISKAKVKKRAAKSSE